MKTGVLGGTFDPVHTGHIALASLAYEKCGLDRVIFMPTGKQSYKVRDNTVSTKDRMKMLSLALQDYPAFETDAYETTLSCNGYTFETLDYLKNKYPTDDIYFIMGEDSLMYMHEWKNPGEILKKCTVISGMRQEYISENGRDFKAQKHYLESKYGGTVILLDGPHINISSTELKSLLCRQRYDEAARYLPGEVVTYISERKLYSNA